jgi:hypothetical protein
MEVGFFTHHLVRHETAECRKWITQTLPDLPPFQSEIVTPYGQVLPKKGKLLAHLKFSQTKVMSTLSRKN